MIIYVPPLILVKVDIIYPLDSTAERVSALSQPWRHMALDPQRQPLGYGFCCRVQRRVSTEMALPFRSCAVQRSGSKKVKILLYHEIRIEPSFNLRYRTTFYDFGKYGLGAGNHFVPPCTCISV